MEEGHPPPAFYILLSDDHDDASSLRVRHFLFLFNLFWFIVFKKSTKNLTKVTRRETTSYPSPGVSGSWPSVD